MFCLLEAFCCIQTLRNEISNRFINIFLLEFGNTGQIVSLLLQVSLFLKLNVLILKKKSLFLNEKDKIKTAGYINKFIYLNFSHTSSKHKN
jgi:hypothetical protein